MMTSEQALSILINTAILAQKAGALSLDDAVKVRSAIGVFQNPTPTPAKEVETELIEETK